MNKRQKKKQLKNQLTEILQLCDNVYTGKPGNVVIFQFDLRTNLYSGRNLQRFESLVQRLKQCGIESMAIQSMRGLNVNVTSYDEAIEDLAYQIEYLKCVRDKSKEES